MLQLRLYYQQNKSPKWDLKGQRLVHTFAEENQIRLSQRERGDNILLGLDVRYVDGGVVVVHPTLRKFFVVFNIV